MSALTVFVCGAPGEALEALGLARDDAPPGRDEGYCDHCGEWLALDDEARAYEQACGYCGRPIYGGA